MHERLAKDLRDIRYCIRCLKELGEFHMLSPRAQAIVDRVNAITTNLQADIANAEAAHDAANEAAAAADDSAIEDSLTTLETALGVQSQPSDPLPPADPAS